MDKTRFRAALFLNLRALLVLVFISGCSTTRSVSTHANANWYKTVIDYKATLPLDHPDQIENMFTVSDEVRHFVQSKFTDKDKHKRARKLARWLIESSGHDMEYRLEANLKPDQAFKEKQGNCLSFTILLITLANDLGIELKYNDVDLPSMWSLDEQAGLVFYRHINAIYKTATHTQIFDLAIEDYDAGFPQRTISQQAAGALLHSNLGVDALRQDDQTLAYHHLKLAASIDPSNPDLWINLGAAYKRFEVFDLAEHAFKIALKLDDKQSLAASNLERLYRQIDRNEMADRYQKIAYRARLNNPYVQYRTAQRQLKESEYKLAKKSIKRAIKLHAEDPKFFELSSLINQHLGDYRNALLSLEKAFNMSKNVGERGRYFNKVKLVAKIAEKEALDRKRKRPHSRPDPRLIDYQ